MACRVCDIHLFWVWNDVGFRSLSFGEMIYFSGRKKVSINDILFICFGRSFSKLRTLHL